MWEALHMLISLVFTSTKLPPQKIFVNIIPVYRLDVQYERLNIEVTYLQEICHSVCKDFLSAIDHLDCHPSMNGTKKTDSKDLPTTS